MRDTVDSCFDQSRFDSRHTISLGTRWYSASGRGITNDNAFSQLNIHDQSAQDPFWKLAGMVDATL